MERLQTRIVGPDGPLDAKICLIGQAPGKDEDLIGLPFQGAAGRRLNNSLRHVGLSRQEILVYNVFVQKPPKNDVSYFFQDRALTVLTWEGQEHVDRLQHWLERLLERREKTGEGPNVIGALGREAMMILTGKKRISKWRGSVLPCTLVEGFKVYPTYHPAYVLRLMNEPRATLYGEKKKQQENILPVFELDLKRIAMQSEFPEIRYPERNIEIATTVPDALEKLDNLYKFPAVAVDIETLPSPSGPLVWCIGFSPSPEQAFVIPILREQKFVWSLQEEAVIWRKISEIFLDKKIKKIFQNGSYDLSILGRYYGLRVANDTYEDTMLLQLMTYPYMKKGLDFLASVYTWEPYYKDEGKVHEGRRASDTAEFIYNGKDCAVTREVLPVIDRDARELGTRGNYDRTLYAFPPNLYRQLRGVRIDLEAKAKLSKDFTARAETAQQIVNLLGEGNFNINSPKDMTKLLYVVLDLPIQYNHKTKKPSSDKDAINMLLKKFPDPQSRANKILTAIKEHRKFSKLASTYTNMEVDSDGRIHTSYSWVSTFRLNSFESHFGNGGNLQNIPTRTEEGRMIRKLFIPDPGYGFLAGDLSQAEAREVAWLAGDKRLIELYRAGDIDVHWERAKETFQLPANLKYEPNEEVVSPLTKEAYPMKFYRRVGKTIVHATNYKMGPMMLQLILIREDVYLPFATCKALLATTRAANPYTVRWQNETSEYVRAHRRLETPLGDVRYFHGRPSDNLFRAAIAFVPQSTVGRIIQLGERKLYSSCSTFEPLLNVHDEILGQCLPEDKEYAKAIMRKCFEIPHEVNGEELVIPVDFKWSTVSWGDMKEED